MSHEFHFLDDVTTADLAFNAVGDSMQDLFQMEIPPPYCSTGCPIWCTGRILRIQPV
ncbi:MAG: hypothetical protein OJF51_004275 [Nitrospira sp.]|nr:MAG: hypothetical protein OJF51_004275 [Nitrospira sp.]